MTKQTQKQRTHTLVLAGMFLAIGVVLPSVTGSIKEIGDTLLPLHLVVMLCGVICGWQYAIPVGAVLPFLRSSFFGVPPLYPNAVAMSLELITYGFVIGFLFAMRKKYSRVWLFVCLICSMLAGRVVWGIAKTVLYGLLHKPFGFQAFLIGGFADALPGIILQFILVPLITELVFHLQKRE